MAWVYLDDQFPDHPKVVRAGHEAAWLFVCGLAYCKRYGTGGVIPKAQVPKLTTVRNALRVAARLVEVNLWEARASDGFIVHDYDDWNQAAASRSEAGRKAAHARWHAKRNANAPPDADANASEAHVPQDALSLTHPQNQTQDQDLGFELTDVESVSNVPPASGYEQRQNTTAGDIVAALNGLADRKAMPS